MNQIGQARLCRYPDPSGSLGFFLEKSSKWV